MSLFKKADRSFEEKLKPNTDLGGMDIGKLK